MSRALCPFPDCGKEFNIRRGGYMKHMKKHEREDKNNRKRKRPWQARSFEVTPYVSLGSLREQELKEEYEDEDIIFTPQGCGAGADDSIAESSLAFCVDPATAHSSPPSPLLCLNPEPSKLPTGPTASGFYEIVHEDAEFATCAPTLQRNISQSHPPYFPFQSEADFDLAKLVYDSNISQKLGDRWIGMMRKHKAQDVSLRSFKDIQSTLSLSTGLVSTPFIEQQFEVRYGNETRVHRIFGRNIVEVVREVLADHDACSKFIWYPVKKYRWSEESLEWNDVADPSTFIIFLILYSDSTLVIKVGNRKCHPIYMWLGNFPLKERSLPGKTGCHLMGFQPIVSGTEEERGTDSFRKYKRQVYLRAYAVVLETIIRIGEAGIVVSCDDGAKRRGVIRLGLMEGDLDELYDVLCLLGPASGFTCPMCLVPRDEAALVTRTYPRRTAVDAREQLARAQHMADSRAKTKAVEELRLKRSMRFESSPFFKLQSDVFEAIGADTLYINGGIIKDHILKALFDKLSGEDKEQIDE
ncbi:hypothetical protein BT69DRAFT_1293704 [Atractiella rhizophila]|nr:hypothetical protein BT69DRAFT_1293704 [Atractiella rhizophila]